VAARDGAAGRLLQDERDMRWRMETKIREKKLEKMSGHSAGAEH
jgi:hypothetical protein